MEPIFAEIDAALKMRLYFAALCLALAVPDICAALESPDGRSNGPRYAAWFDANLGKEYVVLPGSACYELRCGVLHEGTFARRGTRYSRIIFSLDQSYDQNISDDVLQLSLTNFCLKIIAAARSWSASKSGDPHIQKNMAKVV